VIMLNLYKRIQRYFGTLRVEEILGLTYLLLVLLISLSANLYYLIYKTHVSVRVEISVLQIGFTLLLFIGFYGLLWLLPKNKIIIMTRDFSPFLIVLAIYMNLYDMIHFINSNDIHYTLLSVDAWLFGVQPTIWIEQFYHPRLTDWFSFAYMSYYWIAPILLASLYHRKLYSEFRLIMVTMMTAYYIGFLGYIILPAASPYVVIPELYHIDIWKGTSFISKWLQAIVNLSPDRVRDAFPSMHNSITLLTVFMAWRYNRIIFWVLLPLAISLVIATVYLRYHFVADILAGFVVTIMAIYLSPKLDNWWYNWQKRQGIDPEVEKNYGA
jgi:membrane-associated phospholipid phosphatase